MRHDLDQQEEGRVISPSQFKYGAIRLESTASKQHDAEASENSQSDNWVGKTTTSRNPILTQPSWSCEQDKFDSKDQSPDLHA